MRNNKTAVNHYLQRLLDDFPNKTKGWQFDSIYGTPYRIIAKQPDGTEIFIFGVSKRNSGEMVRFLDSLHAYFYNIAKDET